MKHSEIRVASVPGSHIYVRHLISANPTGRVRRLPDPVPADGRTVPGGWWPPLMLDPGWISDHHSEFDVFHVHFGFDAISAQTMTDVVHELRTHHKPLVYTLHDLRNPHHPEPDAHEEVLDILVPAADEIITLTPGASVEISRRWGRDASVLPHPHVVPRERFGVSAGRVDGTFVVGVHVKSVRANMDPLPVIRTLLDAAESHDHMIVRIDAHDEIFDPDNHWFNPTFGDEILSLRRHPRADIRIHPYFSDDELWEYLGSLSASVLPYRFGTHSGWLEACHDLGTPVIAPSCGFYDQQHFYDDTPACSVFEFDESHFDPESLVTALKEVRAAQPTRPTWHRRAMQRDGLDDAHRRLYRRSLGE